MRIGYILFIGLLFAGCSSNQVTLTMRDGAKIESELLSVRDSSIVIQEKGGAPIAIRYVDIDHVFYYENSSPLPYMISGAVVLGTLGVLIGAFDIEHGVDFSEPAKPITGGLIGATVGWFIGGAIAPSDKVLYLDKPVKKELLIPYSKYLSTEEPDELKKIK